MVHYHSSTMATLDNGEIWCWIITKKGLSTGSRKKICFKLHKNIFSCNGTLLVCNIKKLCANFPRNLFQFAPCESYPEHQAWD
jgi:hypothetical protein